MAQAQQDIAVALDTGNRTITTINGERTVLSSSAYRSENASRILDQAISNWETQLASVLRTLEDFDAKIGGSRQGYASADIAAGDVAGQLQRQIGGDGLAGF
jgi:hypothetical protein